MKLQSSCTIKVIATKLKRLSTEWEKISASCTSDGINNQNIQGAKNTKLPQISNTMKKWTKELNRAFSKEEVQMAKNTGRNVQYFWP
jgi:hypothetical protein